ncbi:MAG: YegS/Rv2252/BmrU family lipid kinase [Mycoplasmataceae bacterium]|nr:YegS/Rv2252/BmrU family lipid kinase [Mycoplasmataceae bacterium]
MTYHFIYNPIAGHGLSKQNWILVKEFLHNIDFKYHVHETQSEGHAETITKYLTSKNQPITIICLGGDGTLSEIVNGIQNFDIVTLGVIPSGSGNDFVTATKIPSDDPINALKFALTAQSRKINFINVNNKRAINVVGFGLDTEVLKFYYKLKVLPNKMRYKLATVIKTLFFKWHYSEIRVDNGKWIPITSLLLSIGNGIAIGGGIKMCPEAAIDDDYLNFTYVNKFPRIKTISYLKKVMKGNILKLRVVTSIKCKKVEIKLPNKTFQHDGIISHGDNLLTVSIAKEKIKFLG